MLLSVLSLTVVAQEEKTIAIQQPRGGNAMAVNIVKNMLTNAFASSDEWQPVERPSEEEINMRYLAGQSVGNLQPAQYILTTEINEVLEALYISCNVTNVETGQMVSGAVEMCEPSLQSIQNACASLTKQLLEK